MTTFWTSLYSIIPKKDKNVLMEFTTEYFDEFTPDDKLGMRARQSWYVVDLIHVGRWKRVWERHPYFIPAKLVYMQRDTRYAIGRGRWR